MEKRSRAGWPAPSHYRTLSFLSGSAQEVGFSQKREPPRPRSKPRSVRSPSIPPLVQGALVSHTGPLERYSLRRLAIQVSPKAVRRFARKKFKGDRVNDGPAKSGRGDCCSCTGPSADLRVVPPYKPVVLLRNSRTIFTSSAILARSPHL